MVAVFAEVWRVLKNDGTVWLNLGDSYARMQENNVPQTKNRECVPPSATGRIKNAGLKPKDLCMIPARVAIALQAAGWYLRSEITWCKKSCMPESVTDRPTVATEKIYLLTKSEHYYYDSEAVKEPQAGSSQERAKYGWNGRTDDNSNGARTGSSFRSMAESGEPMKTIPADGLRNMRNFWLLGPEPCRDAHFAVYPSEIPRRAILAGSKPGDVILDPFGGSGTTGKVALELGRRAVLVELNPEYAKLCEQRCTTTRGLPLAV
jgi:site-specific DNA-methyltransferase (cytosine-N4-specific)